MSRDRGPRLKKICRLGRLPGLTRKVPPKSEFNYRKTLYYRKKSSNSVYYNRLAEKQKLRFHYGLTERQLLKYVRMAGKTKGSTGQVLLQLLEMRLDNVLFRLGMASTIPGARQLVNHRHILVNDRIVDIPSYRCKPQDIITTKDKQGSKTLVENSILSCRKNKIFLPNHLTRYSSKSKGLVGLVKEIIDCKYDAYFKINELLIVEHYSRQT